jgi:hypothetical protein
MKRGVTMTYRGHVSNGVIVLDDPAALPEGTEVRVDPVLDDADLRCLREALLKLAEKAKGMPRDMARDHDHYIHGAPRR